MRREENEKASKTWLVRIQPKGLSQRIWCSEQLRDVTGSFSFSMMFVPFCMILYALLVPRNQSHIKNLCLCYSLQDIFLTSIHSMVGFAEKRNSWIPTAWRIHLVWWTMMGKWFQIRSWILNIITRLLTMKVMSISDNQWTKASLAGRRQASCRTTTRPAFFMEIGHLGD